MVPLHNSSPTPLPAAKVTLRPGTRLIGAAAVLMLLGLPAFREPAWPAAPPLRAIASPYLLVTAASSPEQCVS